jgi:hypothetical protein
VRALARAQAVALVRALALAQVAVRAQAVGSVRRVAPVLAEVMAGQAAALAQ